jgi:glycosyltransferase involved in cell wall biosynthesis
VRFGVFVVMAGRNAGGPETYEHSLIRSLVALDRDNEYHIFCLSHTAANSFGLSQENVRYHVLWPEVRWVNIPISLPVALLAGNVDILHATYVPPPFCPVRYVFTMLDVSMFTHPEFYPPAVRLRLKRLVLRGLKQARLVICISQYTRNMVVEALRVPSERLVTIHLGVHDRFRPVPPERVRPLIRKKYGVCDPYVLFVGSLVQRKNVARILEAFDRFRHAVSSDIKLVLAGRRSWAGDEVDAIIERRRLKEQVIQLSYVSEGDLPYLYSGAEMLVFPSLDEGFGFPVLEAMACGTPVLTSTTSSLPEVAGDAAVLVDPYSVADIASGIHRLATDSGLRESLRAKGLARAQLFRWERTARETLEAYKAALH